jgi:SNF2 family DNA or RNA helicase
MSKYIPKLPYFDVQRESLRRGWDKQSFGYLLDMGLGKSKVLLDNICILYEFSTLRRVLIVAPKSVCLNWVKNEIRKHVPDRIIGQTRVISWHNGNRDRALVDYPGLTILVVNVEAISSSTLTVNFCEKFLKMGQCLMAVDESSTIKNYDSSRTKRITKLGRKAKWRRILTGTHVTKSPMDVFSQFEFLEPSCLGYESFFAFRAKFSISKKISIKAGVDPRTGEERRREVSVVSGYRNLDDLRERMAPYCIIARKEDCLDLPPKMFQTRTVEMTEEQSRIYSALRDEASAEIMDGSFVSYTIALVKILRLQQILCGHVVDEKGQGYSIPTKRPDVLEELIDETDGRMIIWCRFRQDVEIVSQRLREIKRSFVQFHGGTPDAQRADAVWRFQGEFDGETCPDRERVDFFVGTPDAGGRGLTLTAARNVVYYSNNYDADKRMQSEDRAHRIGQTGTVSYTDLICPETVEEGIVESLRTKKSLAEIMSEGPSRFRQMFHL